MRFARRVLVTCLLLGLAFLARGCWLGHSRARGYERVARGDSEERVVELLGTPDQTTGATDYVSWDDDYTTGSHDGECVGEYWYRRPLTTCGEEWKVGFDAKGKVVSKYHYISP